MSKIDRLSEVPGLDHTHQELMIEFKDRGFNPTIYHTGGGCTVLRFRVDHRREFWLTRDETWLLGFYHYDENGEQEDDGVFIDLPIIKPLGDYPYFVAAYTCLVMKEMLNSD